MSFEFFLIVGIVACVYIIVIDFFSSKLIDKELKEYAEKRKEQLALAHAEMDKIEKAVKELTEAIKGAQHG